MSDIIYIDMKYLRLLSWLLCCTVLMFSLASCEEKEPDLTKKEMDTRLLGTWKSINSNNPEINKLIFMSNGDIIGYWQMGGKKRVFYTENNCHLFVFVQGLGIKLSNWTYEHYYKIDGNKLTLWYSLYGMNSNSSDRLIFQKEK
ncbi:hypothetical protein [Prevotella intermedia]|uniref:hypothetical protein n=2 Tax=Prevotella intermedia TaxID=28131 RepID=UPI0020053BF2|nr:hypothetical protein [Prevotella intermedia]